MPIKQSLDQQIFVHPNDLMSTLRYESGTLILGVAGCTHVTQCTVTKVTCHTLRYGTLKLAKKLGMIFMCITFGISQNEWLKNHVPPP